MRRVKHCTLFDKARLPEFRVWARAATRSSGRHRRPVALALDKEAAHTAESEGCEVLHLRELEDMRPELREVQRTRNRPGYLLTLKPFFVEVLCATDGDIVCFSDTDCFWWGGVEPIIDELSGPAGEVLLTPRETKLISGSYSDGVFAATPRALGWLELWQALVLEWCEWAPGEDGRWGAEGYLDELVKNPQVVVSKHPGIHLAWWNINNHHISMPAGQVLVDGQPVVCVHYQGLEVGRDGRVLWAPQGRRIRSGDLGLLYAPYVELLKEEMGCH